MLLIPASPQVVFSLTSSECLKEVWKGDMGTKGGAEEEETATSSSAEEEGEKEKEEGKTHDAGEL